MVYLTILMLSHSYFGILQSFVDDDPDVLVRLPGHLFVSLTAEVLSKQK